MSDDCIEGPIGYIKGERLPSIIALHLLSTATLIKVNHSIREYALDRQDPGSGRSRPRTEACKHCALQNGSSECQEASLTRCTQILEAGNAPVGWTLDTDIAAMRSAIAKMRQEQQKPDPSTLPHIEEDIKIPLEDGLQTDARVYTPREMPADGCPGMVVFHGGGYMVGDLETEAWLCELFTKLGGIAVNVDYRHAPEHPFPAAVNDAVVATKWVRMSKVTQKRNSLTCSLLNHNLADESENRPP